jgi:c(7)-type cytochrome triheme protein
VLLPRGGLRVLFVLVLALGTPVSLAVGAAFPAQLRIPRRQPGYAPHMPAALFSHRMHAGFGCYACHPSPFPQAPVGFTHDDMRAGRFCGHCHDGRGAFEVQAIACGGCHAPAR